jgi:hypothetical protein
MSNDKVQRLSFWIVTAVAILATGGRIAQFVQAERFAGPVRFGGEIMAIVGIWIGYFGVLRGLRAARGQVADAVLNRIANSAEMCCLMGYLLALWLMSPYH